MKKIYYFLMAVCLLTVNAAYAQDAGSFTIVDGDIQINSQEDFDKWIVAMNETEDYYSQNVDLNVDVEVASTYDSPFYVVPCFNAEFNGNGHRLTLNLSTSEQKHEAGLTFIQLLYGTVKNLYVDGTIESSVKCMGPIAKDLCENSVVENVCSTVDIVSGTYGDGTHGGIAGRCTGNSTIRNVVFAGSITGEETHSCAGFVGWNSSELTVENSLMIAKIEVGHQSGNTISRGNKSPVCKNVFSNVEINQTPDGCRIVTAEQLASGAVCFALNGDQKNIAWYQNLNEDQVPVLDNTHKTVYANGKSCDGISGLTYNNEGGTVEIIDHEYNETGFCGNCGASDPNFEPQIEYVLVNTPSELVSIANYATKNPTVNIKITADLDMSEVSDQYVPISGGYSGIFDGGGHTISNLIINKPGEKAQALIGVAGECTIKNLTLDETCSITGGEMCAGFVGVPSGGSITMENLVMQGNVKGERNTAGIFACNEGAVQVTMTNCGVSGHIEGGYENGAMSGWSGNAVVTNCWFVGTIEGYEFESNLFCRGSATLTNCYSSVGNQYGVTNISADAAASGELTWKLNGEKSTDVTWYQTIGKDLCPTLNSDHGIVSLSNNGSYISQKTVEIKISEENEWVTYMQPFATELPTGVQAFTADGVNGDYLILKEASSLNANTPYILYAEDGHESSQTGTMEVADGKAVKAGVLSGALDAQQITSGYVLQNQGNGAMFYKVNESIIVPSGKCWLDLSSDKKAIRIHNNGANGIDGIEHKLEEKGIYTIDGKAVSNPQSGKIYVIDGKKVMKL